LLQRSETTEWYPECGTSLISAAMSRLAGRVFIWHEYKVDKLDVHTQTQKLVSVLPVRLSCVSFHLTLIVG